MTVVGSSNKVLASQDNPPPVYNVNGVDAATSPTGWTFSTGCRRMRSTNNNVGNLPSPSGSAYYDIMPGTGKFMTTTVENLVVGRQYQIGGFVSNRPNYVPSAVEVRFDGVAVFETTTANGFVAFGPVTVLATATSHTLGIFNVSSVTEGTIYIDGLYMK